MDASVSMLLGTDLAWTLDPSLHSLGFPYTPTVGT